MIQKQLATITDNNNLYLTFDKKGRILDLIMKEGQPVSPFFQDIIDTGQLSPFFYLDSLTMDRSNRALTLPGKPIDAPYRLNYYYLSALHAIHNIHCVPIPGDLWMGRMSIIDILPNLLSSRRFLIVNLSNETLEAIEQSLLDFIAEPGRTGKDMIGTPLSHYLSPTPVEFQKKHIQFEDPEQAAGFENVFHHSLSEQFVDILTSSRNLTIKKEHNGWFIRNDGNDNAFLTVNFPLNTGCADLVMNFCVEDIHAHPPFITLTSNQSHPDSHYLAGFTLEDHRGLMIKRAGFRVAQEPHHDGPLLDGDFIFCKYGRSLHFQGDATHRIAYYDEEFVNIKDAVFSLGLRAGTSLRLKHVTLKKRALTKEMLAQCPTQYVARVLTRPDRHLILTRYYTNALASNPANLAGYLSLDISTLQNNLIELSNNYEGQKKRATVLSGLLRGYQSRDTEPFLGDSVAISNLRETAETAARSETTLLIEGATGTGKEVLARYIHEKSARKNNIFVKVDCATIPRSLIESQLFGHEKGAFTGAFSRHIGMFEQAQGGTLFLDEVGNLPLDTQAKLLQFFNDFTITRIGGGKPVPVNVRCILASNENLAGLVAAGAFRSDLFYRINVLTLLVPALVNHMEDITILAHHFLFRYASLNNRDIRTFAPEAMDKLRQHAWPGNIRELRNVIQRAVIFCKGDVILPENILFGESGRATSDKEPRPKQPGTRKRYTQLRLGLTKSSFLKEILKKHLGRVDDAARELGVGRMTLYLHLKRLNINPARYRKGFGGA